MAKHCSSKAFTGLSFAKIKLYEILNNWGNPYSSYTTNT